MIKTYIKIIAIIFLAFLNTVNLYAGDSSLINIEQQISNEFLAQIKLNKEKESQGKPKDFIVRVNLSYNPITDKWVSLNQANTTDAMFKTVWDFDSNPKLLQLQNKLNEFSATQQMDYYVIVAAIYNYEATVNESFNPSQLKWKDVSTLVGDDLDSDSLRSNLGGQISPYKKWAQNIAYSNPGQSEFRAIDTLFWGLIKKMKVKMGSNWGETKKTLGHFVISLYVPDKINYSNSFDGVIYHVNGLMKNSKITSDEFRLFRSLFGDLNQDYISDHQSINTSAGKEDWLYSRVDTILAWAKEFVGFNELILTKTNQADMLDLFQSKKNILPILLSGIDTVSREFAIRKICEGNLVDENNWLHYGSSKGSENILLKVIESTPKEHSRFLKRILLSDNYALFKKMTEGTDDVGPWGTSDNYTSFAKTVTAKLSQTITNDELNSIIENNKIFYYDSQNEKLKPVTTPSYIDVPEPSTGYGQLFTDVAYSSPNLKINFNQYKLFHSEIIVNSVIDYDLKKYETLYGRREIMSCIAPASCSTQVNTSSKKTMLSSEKMGPLDFVVIIPKQDISYNGYDLKQDELYLIPAFYFKWLEDKEYNETAGKVAIVAVTAVAVVASAGTLSTAVVAYTAGAEGASLVTIAFAGTETLFSVTAFADAVSSNQFDEMIKNDLGTEGYSAYKMLQTVFTFYAAGKGVFKMSKGVATNVKNISGNFYNALKNAPNFIKNLKTGYPKQFELLKSFMASTCNSNIDDLYTLASGKISQTFSTFKTSLSSLTAPINQSGLFKLFNKPGGKVILEATDEAGTVFKTPIDDVVNNIDEASGYTEELILRNQRIKYMRGVDEIGEETGDIVVASKLVNNSKQYCLLGKYMCFVTGTPVHTSTGSFLIENIKKDDEVIAYDAITKSNKIVKVLSVFKRTATRFVRLALAGTFITCTPEHPFYVNGNWVQAKDLGAGTILKGVNNEAFSLLDKQEFDSTGIVYNIETSDFHNYYAGNFGVLVHNDCTYGNLTQRLTVGGTDLFNRFQSRLFTSGVFDTPKRLRLYKWMAGRTDEELINFVNKSMLAGDEFVEMLSKGGDDFCNFFKNAKPEFQELLVTRAGVSGYARSKGVQGMVYEYKKFPQAKDPNKGWVLDQAKKYQAQSSGNADLSFKMTNNGITASFDDFKDGVLIDRKFGHGNSIFVKEGSELSEINIINHDRVNSLIEQARRQILSAGNRKIRWEIQTELGAEGLKQVFNNPLLKTTYPGIDFTKLEIKYVQIFN